MALKVAVQPTPILPEGSAGCQEGFSSKNKGEYVENKKTREKQTGLLYIKAHGPINLTDLFLI